MAFRRGRSVEGEGARGTKQHETLESGVCGRSERGRNGRRSEAKLRHRQRGSDECSLKLGRHSATLSAAFPRSPSSRAPRSLPVRFAGGIIGALYWFSAVVP